TRSDGSGSSNTSAREERGPGPNGPHGLVFQKVAFGTRRREVARKTCGWGRLESPEGGEVATDPHRHHHEHPDGERGRRTGGDRHDGARRPERCWTETRTRRAARSVSRAGAWPDVSRTALKQTSSGHSMRARRGCRWRGWFGV